MKNNMGHILYKYIDIDGAICMIHNQNLQFTNATQLNDPFDCHPKLVDYSNVSSNYLPKCTPKEWLVKKEESDALIRRNETWLCSLSKVNDSLLMWSHYCYNHTGVCIGLDIDIIKKSIPMNFGTFYLEPFILNVQYQDIIKRPNAHYVSLEEYKFQWMTKAREWEYEHEVRLVMPKPSHLYADLSPKQKKDPKPNWDWCEIPRYLPLTCDSFESIYFGINIDPIKKEQISDYIRESVNPHIKLYQMTVDENAFRLKSEVL